MQLEAEKVAGMMKVHQEHCDEQEWEQDHRDGARLAAMGWRSGCHAANGDAEGTMISMEKRHP
jgi:hypothetical protein